MAIPFQVEITEICKAALRGAGQPAPSNGMIMEAVGNQFREVLNDIKLAAPTHPLLLTNEITVTTIGVRDYAQPATCNVVKSVLLHDGPDNNRITITGGSASTVTMSAADAATITDTIGRTMFILTGTGALQRSYITSPGATTSVSPNWTTNPANLDTILVADLQHEIYNTAVHQMNMDVSLFASKGRPDQAAIQGERLWIDRPADKIYPLYWTFYVDPDKLSESSDLFKKMLREWRSIFVEGVRAKSMVVYDDTRQYDHYAAIYRNYLSLLSAETIEAVQTVPHDYIFN